MAEAKRESIYIKSKDRPGVYVYRPDLADDLRKRDARLWNEEAPKMLDEMYERLGVPEHLRR